MRFQQEANDTMRDFVDELLESFKQECIFAADRGKFSVSMCSSILTLSPLYRDDDYTWSTPDEVIAKITQQIEEKLVPLAFTDCSMSSELCGEDGETGRNDYCRWRLCGAWDGAKKEKTTTEQPTAPAGSPIHCPICLEKKPGVALVPCGHTVCQECAPDLRSKPCPQCRKTVTFTTSGLFLA